MAPRREKDMDDERVVASEPPPSSSAGEPSAAHLAHAINNPLAIVATNLDLLDELLGGDAKELPARVDELREIVREARDAAERLRLIAGRIDGGTRQTPSSFAPEEPITASQPRRIRVLVVDDEPALARSIGRALRDYDVETLTDATQVIARVARGERYDVVISDLMMPDVTGMDLHEELSRLAPDQAERMIFLTGGATTTRARDFVTANAERVIAKPLTPQRLRKLVQRSVAGSRKRGGDGSR